jgi:uncharacterized protein YndB with AHSA1/START domain
MKLEVATDIAAPPHVVFATMTDLSALPAFVSGIRTIEILTPGPLQVGTRFRETRVMFGKEAAEEMTFAALEPPHRVVLTAENHGARYVTTHNIEASGGGSRLTFVFEGVPLTFAARLFSVLAPLFAGSIRKHLAGDLADVKAEAERRATGERGS